jgi:hypothetical protein
MEKISAPDMEISLFHGDLTEDIPNRSGSLMAGANRLSSADSKPSKSRMP